MSKYSLNLARPWKEVKEKIKEHNLEITDSDLDYSPGKEQELLERLGKILNKSSEEVKILIESISGNKDMAG